MWNQLESAKMFLHNCDHVEQTILDLSRAAHETVETVTVFAKQLNLIYTQ